MERFAQRENVLLGYSPQRSFGNPSFGPRTPLRTSDVDFHDVFGGPPRRYSSQEIQYSFGEPMESTRGAEAAILSRNPWSGLSEKPVFGDETVNRRRCPSDDFFGDIFRGDESYSSPRRSDRDLLCSSPGSRVLSPVRPLPPKAEPLSSSLPAQFSLPAKLTKVDLPAFGTCNQSPYRHKNGASNGISFSYASSPSLSRFSSQSTQEQDELKNDIQPSSRQGHLSREFPSKESSHSIKSDETDRSKFVKDSESAEAPNSVNQFHFSIYKWASKGVPVPLMMPLRKGNSVKLKDNGKIERCSSSNGRMENERLISELLVGNGDLSELEGEKQKRVSLLKRNTQDKVETCQIIEETVLAMTELNSLNSFCSMGENISDDSVVNNKREETKPPFPEVPLCEKTEKESCAFSQGACKPELKPLYSLFDGDNEREDDDMTMKDAGKENTVKTTEVTPSNVKYDVKRTSSNRAVVNEASSHNHSVNLRDNHGRNGVKGKVKEFVKIFNQEASSKPKINVDTQGQSCRWKSRHNYGADCEGNGSRSETHGKMHMLNVNKMKTVNTNFEQLEKRHSHLKATFHERSVNSSRHKNASVWSFESLTDSNKLGNIEDPFQDNFQIKELPHNHGKEPQTDKDYDDLEFSDVKIRQWSNGKAGNIRSLLSTLQYILWPESGWKPVPLVDLIEGSAVKRAYQKALLCLHPDKLQQKGVESHQKYIAEKVFDILQEAWDHFSSLGSL